LTDDDMDFTKPQPDMAAASAPFKASGSRFYDSKVAAQIFKLSGAPEQFKAEQIVFVEDDGKARGANRMYYLVDGEVTLTIGGRPLGTVGKGEIFGEMAVITGRPRSASARAFTSCTAYSMDAQQLQAALTRIPEFGLMLASVMFDRLRFVAQKLASRTKAPGSAAREASVFDPPLVAQLEAALPRSALVRFNKETVIFKEGQSGTFMYLVKEGRIAIAVGSNIVEVIGPGGTFGEMAVVDQSPRGARAGAMIDSVLLAIDRPSLMEVVKKHPAIAVAMLRGVAERLRHMNKQLTPQG
jgi:CRP/FNR family transcriptional regulator, cyclic AMP receptor protein